VSDVKADSVEDLVSVLLGRRKPRSKDRPQAEILDAGIELATRVDRLLRAVGAVETQPYRYSYSWHLDTDQIKEILGDDLC
jgi:hypothetical protein